jgi:hypothetical protein
MTTAPTTPGAPRPRGRAGALLVALFVAALLLCPARAGAAAPAPAPAAPAFADGLGSSKIWGPLEWALGSQRRMLQVATVGMCLALYIIMWRK